MLQRNILLVVGTLLVLAGVGLSLAWVGGAGRTQGELIPQAAIPQGTPEKAAVQPTAEAVLEAAHFLPAGTLLRQGDVRWREVKPEESQPGTLLRSESPRTGFLGAITRRDFVQGEALITTELVKPGDRHFLSAVLAPGSRAVSLSVDAAQSFSGLILPGDRVDVILAQNLGDIHGLARKTVAETVLRNVRVIAVDQSLNAQKPASFELPAMAASRLPKTVTLEVSEVQAQKLFVAMQLGALQFSVRALEGSEPASGGSDLRAVTWAADVSPALGQLPRTPSQPLQGSTIESSIRRPPSLAF